jgi:hypothetical protein
MEFLTDEQAEAYGTFTEVPTRPELAICDDVFAGRRCRTIVSPRVR